MIHHIQNGDSILDRPRSNKFPIILRNRITHYPSISNHHDPVDDPRTNRNQQEYVNKEHYHGSLTV